MGGHETGERGWSKTGGSPRPWPKTATVGGPARMSPQAPLWLSTSLDTLHKKDDDDD